MFLCPRNTSQQDLSKSHNSISNELLLCFLAFIVLVPSCQSVEAKHPANLEGSMDIVVDTDMGADDILALLYLLQAPNVEVKAISLSGVGLVHCGPGLEHIEYLLSITDNEHIPFGCGPQQPLQGIRSFPEGYRAEADNFYGLEFDQARKRKYNWSGVELLSSTVRMSEEKVTLLTLGPLTNIAAVIEQDPSLISNLEKIVIMGGAVNVPGNTANGNSDSQNEMAEWNFFIDPVAVNIVLRSGAPVTMVPLDATNQVPVTTSFYSKLNLNRDSSGAVLAYELFEKNPHLIQGGYFFWDPLAAVLSVDDELANIQLINLRIVETDGIESGRALTSSEGWPVRVAMEVDSDRFEQVFLNGLNGRVADVPLNLPVEVTYPNGELLWRFEVEYNSAGTNLFYFHPPMIQEGVIYFAGIDGGFHALDPFSGQEVWAFDPPGYIYPYSIATDQTVFLGSTEKTLYALDLLSGLEKWHFEGTDSIGDPALGNNLVFLGSENGDLYALDQESGIEIWRHQTPGRTDLSEIVLSHSRVIFSDFVNSVYAVEEDTGELAWQIESDEPIVSLVASEDLVYFSNQERQVIAVQIENGEEIWRTATGESNATHFTITDEALLVLTGDLGFVALDPQTGVELWDFELQGCYPVVLPMIGRTILLGSEFGELSALDARTGGTIWKFYADQRVCLAINSHEGYVYVGGLSGDMYVLDGQTGVPVWRFQAGGFFFSIPAIEEDMVFLQNGDGYFYAIQGPQTEP